MAKSKIPDKCVRCALLSADTAKKNPLKCWVSATCPSKRHYIKNRDRISHSRKKRRTQIIHQVEAPEVVYANLLIWRELRQDSPIHAIGASIWDGKEQLSTVPPEHCSGWLPDQVHSYVQQILDIIGDEYGFQKFATQIVEHPEQCPIRPCPFHSSTFSLGFAGRGGEGAAGR